MRCRWQHVGMCKKERGIVMKKKNIYLTAGIIGIALIVTAVVLGDRISDTVNGVFAGLGAGLAGLGIAMWRFCRFAEKEPGIWKQYEIESRDERNVVIRLRAKAAAGEILQWTVMAAAWAAIFLKAPLWVILGAVGIFLFKIILEMCLMARYQKEM